MLEQLPQLEQLQQLERLVVQCLWLRTRLRQGLQQLLPPCPQPLHDLLCRWRCRPTARKFFWVQPATGLGPDVITFIRILRLHM